MTFNRREFLNGGLLMGGLMATSALPAFAADDKSLFAARGAFERMSLTYRHIHVGLPSPFSVLHISDTHLTEANADDSEELRTWAETRRRTFGGCQQASLATSVEWAKANCDYILHTGDLIDFQTKENLACVRKIFGTTEGLFGATGNHEYQREARAKGISNTAAYNALSRNDLDNAYGFDTEFRATVAGGVDFVAIDQVYGTVTAEQAARFEAEAKKGLPIVLCMHAPFYTDDIWLAHEAFWRSRGKMFRVAAPEVRGEYKRQRDDGTTRDFIAYAKSIKNLKAVLCGHLHINFEDRFSPTAMEYVVAGNFVPVGEQLLFT